MAKKAKAKVKDDKKTASFEVGTRLPRKLMKIWDADHPIKPYFASNSVEQSTSKRSSFIVALRGNENGNLLLLPTICRIYGERVSSMTSRRMNPTMVRFTVVPHPFGRVVMMKTTPKSSKKKKKSKRATKKKSKGQ